MVLMISQVHLKKSFKYHHLLKFKILCECALKHGVEMLEVVYDMIDYTP